MNQTAMEQLLKEVFKDTTIIAVESTGSSQHLSFVLPKIRVKKVSFVEIIKDGRVDNYRFTIYDEENNREINLDFSEYYFQKIEFIISWEEVELPTIANTIGVAIVDYEEWEVSDTTYFHLKYDDPERYKYVTSQLRTVKQPYIEVI